ncbi:hypothetical protein TNCV_2062791 [Trichonephila clavipes]|nr:hypothetical protein TNCV_2062791 [Trichonephila clavipes]
MSSSPVPLKARRVWERCTLNLSIAQTFSRWCGARSGVVHGTPVFCGTQFEDHCCGVFTFLVVLSYCLTTPVFWGKCFQSQKLDLAEGRFED